MRILGLVAALALAACQTPCPPAPERAPRTHTFACADESTLTVVFSGGPARAHIEQDGYPALDLPLAGAASGFRYAADGAELRGRLGAAYWTRPGAAETLCRAAGASARP